MISGPENRPKNRLEKSSHNRKEGNRPKNYVEIAFLIAVLRNINENILIIALKC